MLELLTYPIAAVMKMWHLLLHNLFGVDASLAWIFSIILLVATVRSALVPLSWAQKRSARRSALMRPEMLELEEKYGSSTDPEDIAAHTEAQKDLQRRYQHNPLIGCLPLFIQIPIVIGLYRLLLWMSRPETMVGHENADGGIGLLSGAEVDSFRDAHLFGAPIPAYLSMPESQLSELGTSLAAITPVLSTFIIAATILTTANMAVSVYFTYTSLDWSQKIGRGMLKVLYGLCVFMPLFILWFGFFGPLPLALALYWVTSNLWTVGQITILNWLAYRRWPDTDVHRELREKQRREFFDEKKELKQRKKADREHVRTAAKRGSSRAEAKAEIKRRNEKALAAEKAEKDELKARNKEIARIRSQQMAQRMKQRRAERFAKKRGETGVDKPASEES